MRPLDKQERRIIRNLIKNPRISDNQLAKLSGIPTITVNRKRKKLEAEGLLHYYADVAMDEEGTHTFHARQLYIVQLRSGITRRKYLDYILNDNHTKTVFTKYVTDSYLGEQDGRLALILIFEAETELDLMEIFNGLFIKGLKKQFGPHAVTAITTTKINTTFRRFRNYMPFINLSGPVVVSDWPEELVYVSSKQSEEEHLPSAIYSLYDFDEINKD